MYESRRNRIGVYCRMNLVETYSTWHWIAINAQIFSLQVCEVGDVCETGKIYQLGNTRTNKGLRLRYVYWLELITCSEMETTVYRVLDFVFLFDFHINFLLMHPLYIQYITLLTSICLVLIRYTAYLRYRSLPVWMTSIFYLVHQHFCLAHHFWWNCCDQRHMYNNHWTLKQKVLDDVRLHLLFFVDMELRRRCLGWSMSVTKTSQTANSCSGDRHALFKASQCQPMTNWTRNSRTSKKPWSMNLRRKTLSK